MKKGNAIMIAFGKGKPSKDDESDSEDDMKDDDEEEEGEVSKEAVSAASEFKDAIKSGDAKLIAMAFKNLKSACEEY